MGAFELFANGLAGLKFLSKGQVDGFVGGKGGIEGVLEGRGVGFKPSEHGGNGGMVFVGGKFYIERAEGRELVFALGFDDFAISIGKDGGLHTQGRV